MPAALGSTSAAESTSCAAPSAGVFVVAPQKSPTAIAGGIPTTHARPVVTTAPRTTTVTPPAFSANPCRRMAARKTGPICIRIVKTKRMSPSSLHEVGEMRIEPDPQPSERDAREERTGAPEADVSDAQPAEPETDRRHEREDEHRARDGVATE